MATSLEFNYTGESKALNYAFYLYNKLVEFIKSQSL